MSSINHSTMLDLLLHEGTYMENLKNCQEVPVFSVSRNCEARIVGYQWTGAMDHYCAWHEVRVRRMQNKRLAERSGGRSERGW